MTAPLDIDGVTLTDTTDFADLARRSLLGQSTVGGVIWTDSDPAAGAFRFYERLKQMNSPYAAMFSKGISRSLSAPEPPLRQYALFFFQSFPDAAGGERVNELVAGDRSLFEGHKVQGWDLDFSLLRALGARIRGGDRTALGLARNEALKPGKADGVIAALTANDPDWVIARVENIIKGSPDVAATIFRQLQRAGRDVIGVGIRMGRVQGIDLAKFREAVEGRVTDPAVRARILAALPHD